MNKELLNDMATYLENTTFGEGGPEGDFNMKCFHDCVLGHYTRREAHRLGMVKDYTEVVQEAPLMGGEFGIKRDSVEWDFAFAPTWGRDSKAAASRLRYLAENGTTPPAKTWKAFMQPQHAMALKG